MASVFNDSRVVKLFSGQLLAQTCDRMTTLGLIWYLGTQIGTGAIAWFLAVAGLPHLLLNHLAPKAIQKWGLVETTYAMDFARAVLFAVAALLWKEVGHAEVALLFVIVFVSNVGAAFFNPALLSLPVKLFAAEKVQSVTGLFNTCFSVALVLGPVIALPVASSRAGLVGVFALTALAYAASGFCTWSVKQETLLASDASSPDTEAPKKARPLREFLRQESGLFILLASFFFINIFLAPLQLSLPDFARTRFGGHMSALAWQEGALGAGMLLGSFALAFYKISWSRARSVVVLLWIMFLCLAVFSQGYELVRAVPSLFCFGVALAMLNVVALEVFQLVPRAAELPQVMSWVNLISVATLPLSMSACAWLLPRWGLGFLWILSLLSFFAVNIFASVTLRRRIFAYAA